MDIFEKRHFNFNRKLLVFLGLWPVGTGARNIRKYVLLSMLFLSNLPHLISAKVHFSDIDRMMLNLVSIFILFLMFLKVLSLIMAEDKMKGLYRNIADNWLAITDEKEKNILFEYSERGRKKAVYYFVFVQIGGCSVYTLPTLPKILDMIDPLSEPRPRVHILEGEVFIDKQTYYWFYYISDFVTVLIATTVSVSVDTMYIICVEHCCALYAIVRYRLRNLKSKLIDRIAQTEIKSHVYFVDIVRMHRNTLNFTETINEAFSVLFLYILIANLACIPLTAVTVLSNLDKPYNFLRFGTLFIVLGVHLFMLFWPGQNVLDLGTGLIDDAYCSEWYTTPLRTRKMIVLFMIRCTRPALLIAGGLMLMNFETFFMIARTAVSYITVVASFR